MEVYIFNTLKGILNWRLGVKRVAVYLTYANTFIVHIFCCVIKWWMWIDSVASSLLPSTVYRHTTGRWTRWRCDDNIVHLNLNSAGTVRHIQHRKDSELDQIYSLLLSIVAEWKAISGAESSFTVMGITKLADLIRADAPSAISHRNISDYTGNTSNNIPFFRYLISIIIALSLSLCYWTTTSRQQWWQQQKQ